MKLLNVDLVKNNMEKIINKYPHIPKEQRKKILLLSDDMRMNSGVATMSREFVMGTAHHYNWIQLAGAIKHKDFGKVIDLSDSVNKEINITDSYVKLYPTHEYGNQELIRELLSIEKIDAILHYTDPRFWIWLYEMEHEIRQNIPIFYYNIWDDLPYPHYNQSFYESCDWIGCISKQTENIVKNVWTKNPPEDWQITYIPHGINENIFHPIDDNNEDLLKFKKELFGDFEPEFVLFYNNRNIKRKLTSDVILAYKTFCDMLPREKANKCLLLMHTHPVDENGTDLPTVINMICPDYKVVFSTLQKSANLMNYLYNISDVTINIASNEGWGLSTTESLMSGTPILINVTGGLIDQCRFEDENGNIIKYSTEFPTNHNGKYKKHGNWVKVVFPKVRTLKGSIPTPYIFDDLCSWEDVAEKIKEWYDIPRIERKKFGLNGRTWAMSSESMMSAREMSKNFMHDMDIAFKNWKPQKRFKLYDSNFIERDRKPTGILKTF